MGQQTEARHDRHTVLIVDDDEQVAKSLKDRLDRAGYETMVASSGRAALAQLEEKLPCMALLDVAMPGMGGLALCKVMKQNPRTESIPVAFVTGQVETEDIEAGQAVGAIDYIKKPFDNDELRVRVRVQIRLHQTLRTQKQIERHLSLISEAAKDAVIIMNNAGEVANWNQTAVNMFGYGEAEAVEAVEKVYFAWNFGSGLIDDSYTDQVDYFDCGANALLLQSEKSLDSRLPMVFG